MKTLLTRRAGAYVGILLLPLLISGCASQGVTQTGFLSHYSHMKPASTDNTALSYKNMNIARNTYTKVLIDHVTVQLPAEQAAGLDVTLINQARADYRLALENAFSKQYALATETGPGTLRVRAALTGLKPSNPMLNAATILLVGPLSNGGVSTEAEVVDALSGERVAALATFTNGNLFNGGLGGYFDKLGHVRKAFDAHATDLRDLSAGQGAPRAGK